MEVNGQIYDPTALTPGKETPVQIGRKAGWAPEPVWTRWRRERNLCPCRESSPGVSARV